MVIRRFRKWLALSLPAYKYRWLYDLLLFIYPKEEAVLNYETQSYAVKALKKEMPWWSGLKIGRTNEKGMICIARHWPHCTCWDWSFWFGVRRVPTWKFKKGWPWYSMDLPGIFQFGCWFFWLNISYASQIGKSDWMLTGRAEQIWAERHGGKLHAEVQAYLASLKVNP